MTKILTYCFDKWWRPVLVFGLTALIMVLCELTNKPKLQDYSFLLFVLGFLGLIISTIYQLVKRRWRFVILTTTIIGISFLKFRPYPYSLEGILVSLNSLMIVWYLSFSYLLLTISSRSSSILFFFLKPCRVPI